MGIKRCTHCENPKEDSFALQLVRGYKKMFITTTSILTAIIIILLGVIFYDTYSDAEEHSENRQIIQSVKYDDLDAK